MLGEVVRLVRHQQHGLLGAAELVRDLVVEVGDAILHVDDEEDDVGLVHGYLHLLIDLALEDVLAADDPAACVDDGELVVEPGDLAVLTVARRAGLLADDGAARLRQAVEEGGLPDVGAPYYCY